MHGRIELEVSVVEAEELMGEEEPLDSFGSVACHEPVRGPN